MSTNSVPLNLMHRSSTIESYFLLWFFFYESISCKSCCPVLFGFYFCLTASSVKSWISLFSLLLFKDESYICSKLLDSIRAPNLAFIIREFCESFAFSLISKIFLLLISANPVKLSPRWKLETDFILGWVSLCWLKNYLSSMSILEFGL